jgi:hypothetical protein
MAADKIDLNRLAGGVRLSSVIFNEQGVERFDRDNMKRIRELDAKNRQ